MIKQLIEGIVPIGVWLDRHMPKEKDSLEELRKEISQAKRGEL